MKKAECEEESFIGLFTFKLTITPRVFALLQDKKIVKLSSYVLIQVMVYLCIEFHTNLWKRNKQKYNSLHNIIVYIVFIG